MSNFILLILALFIVSCSTLPSNTVHGSLQAIPSADAKVTASTDIQRIEKVKKKIALTKKRNPKKTASPLKYKYKLAPKTLNRATKRWVEYYTKKDRKRFQRFLNRGANYKSFIQAMLVEYKLPPDLYYLGVLESGYSTAAVSHAGAVGAWQFMRPTGREYGLKINNYVDERLDPVRSTIAAIKYLKELHRQTRDWKLALAAYNAGPGRVRRAIRRGGKNFWRLSQRRLLPRDTRNYIPQFLAMVHIGKNLKKFGFIEKATGKFHRDLHLVSVPSPVYLKDISRITNLSVAKLKKINPHLKKGVTPPHLQNYDVWVPKAQAVSLISKRPTLAKKVIKGLKATRRVSSRRRTPKFHRVRKGDTLIGIAKRYKKYVRYLKRRNKISRRGTIRIGQKIYLSGSVHNTVALRQKKSTRYKVRRGDSLIGIAKKFKTSVKKLKTLNKIRGSRILKGQVITVAKK